MDTPEAYEATAIAHITDGLSLTKNAEQVIASGSKRQIAWLAANIGIRFAGAAVHAVLAIAAGISRLR